MKIDYCVYCYACHCENCLGRDVYVGKSKYGIANRHKGHLKCVKRILEGRSTKKDIRFDSFIAKHGVQNCQIRLLESFQSEEEMNVAEMRFITELKTLVEYGGMNFDIGGKGGRRKGVYIPSEQTKLKQSESMKEHFKREPLTQEAKEHLSYVSVMTHKTNPTLGKRKNAQSWKTISERRSDPTYDENFHEMMRNKAHLGAAAFLEKFENEQFKNEFSMKVSKGVSKWCVENPILVRKRAEKCLAARIENGTWLESVREASKRVTKEQRSERIRKGWETRRKNSLNKAVQLDDNENHAIDTPSPIDS
jgi:hypothetical protein